LNEEALQGRLLGTKKAAGVTCGFLNLLNQIVKSSIFLPDARAA